MSTNSIWALISVPNKIQASLSSSASTTMSGSRHHHSSSPDESYRPLPQSDDDASELPVPTQADIKLDGEGSEESFSDDPIDPRIKRIYFVSGCAILLPWNCAELSRLSVHSSTDYMLALITATPYFLSRLSGSPYQSTFGSYLSSSYTAASFLSLIYSTATSTQVRVIIKHSACALVGVDWCAAGFTRTKNICVYYCTDIPNPSVDSHHFRSRASTFILLIRTDD